MLLCCSSTVVLQPALELLKKVIHMVCVCVGVGVGVGGCMGGCVHMLKRQTNKQNGNKTVSMTATTTP